MGTHLNFSLRKLKAKTDILTISETKTDERFPRGSKGGEIMLYVREDIPFNLIAFEGRGGFEDKLSTFLLLSCSNFRLKLCYRPHSYQTYTKNQV